MSEPIPESIPTSQDRHSQRPTKKARWTSNAPSAEAVSKQHAAVSSLFARQPDIQIPTSATKGPKTTADLAAPPEIVANVQGSSAGAGSGEFHVYKASRRREYERTRLMEEEAKREEEDRKWKEEREAKERRDKEKVGKNRRRREKMKARKGKKDANGKMEDGDDERMDEDVDRTAEHGLPAAAVKNGDEAGLDDAGGTQDDGVTGQGIVIHDDD